MCPEIRTEIRIQSEFKWRKSRTASRIESGQKTEWQVGLKVARMHKSESPLEEKWPESTTELWVESGLSESKTEQKWPESKIVNRIGSGQKVELKGAEMQNRK